MLTVFGVVAALTGSWKVFAACAFLFAVTLCLLVFGNDRTAD
jgi:hypothetical protein